MLDFDTLLELAGVDPSEVLIVRHVPVEKSLKRVLPWLLSSVRIYGLPISASIGALSKRL
jgi:hypothetical protein